MKIGDTVRVIGTWPSDYKIRQQDELRTLELFRFWVGREFKVRGFDRYGYVELWPGDDPKVRKEFGNGHSIWMEPEFLRITKIGKKLPKAARRIGEFCERCRTKLNPAKFVRCPNCYWPFEDRRSSLN